MDNICCSGLQWNRIGNMSKSGQYKSFSARDLRSRAKGHLVADYSQCVGNWRALVAKSCPASVLVPVVDRGDNAHVLLTRRADDHPHHAGQISFPGGKITSWRETIIAAALRETLEETSIEARYIDILGHLDRHVTGTGFTIYPVVGIVDSSFCAKPCDREVAEIFEVPLSFLMKDDNYRIEKIIWRGRARDFYVIDYGSYRIWGATAAILKRLQERLFESK
jgi:8-oxo-dGTP pyrophosphatase MutT (NUDIX family)